jgi:signal transduction protein with GAF and PtsI domain
LASAHDLLSPFVRRVLTTCTPVCTPFLARHVGIQCDLAKEGLVKNSAQMEQYCEEKGFVGWFETSAKENLNINQAAEFLVQRIIDNDQVRNASELPLRYSLASEHVLTVLYPV